jgi:CBS domain-containing protein
VLIGATTVGVSMRISDILGDKGIEVHTALPWISVADAARRLTAADVGALVVCDADRRIRGVVSERDIVRHLARHGAALEAPVEAIMTHEVHTCSSQETVARAMALMTRFRYRHLPVVDDGRLVGIISIGDLVKHRVYEMELETGVLRDRVIARH